MHQEKQRAQAVGIQRVERMPHTGHSKGKGVKEIHNGHHDVSLHLLYTLVFGIILLGGEYEDT